MLSCAAFQPCWQHQYLVKMSPWCSPSRQAPAPPSISVPLQLPLGFLFLRRGPRDPILVAYPKSPSLNLPSHCCPKETHCSSAPGEHDAPQTEAAEEERAVHGTMKGGGTGAALEQLPCWRQEEILPAGSEARFSHGGRRGTCCTRSACVLPVPSRVPIRRRGSRTA